ncbi:TRAP-type C4-dicarboxylate transport system permease small subunit [Hydrogenophaga palleronii]|uniref:TRAP transporter small permease protein n=1 Tax=Hydrogenophaga palleronii TaxID=65655 RepID=A0ABU1WJ05_9BURK|nr:TRAP transporter small permease [Hydrogenophaga palleronii]MDR7149260.1 TRAP-type C4-dicarboxylate transport system permease small subunit [Hydrogenophaga palleronii]
MQKTLDRLLYWSTGLMASMALFAIMWLTLIDVSGRKFLSNSVPGALEITEILMVIVIFGALPLVSWRNEHVTFDSFDAFIPDWLKNIQARLVDLLCGAVFAFLGYLMVTRGDRFQEYGDTTAYLLLPVAPVAYLMAALLFLTAATHFVRAFLKRPPGHGPAYIDGSVS